MQRRRQGPQSSAQYPVPPMSEINSILEVLHCIVTVKLPVAVTDFKFSQLLSVAK